MNKIHALKALAAALLLVISCSSQAANIIRSKAPIAYSGDVWHITDSLISAWANGDTLSCDGWTPNPLSQSYGATFSQAQTCLFEQTRTVQGREVNQDGDVRLRGVATTETQQASRTDNRTLTWASLDDLILQNGGASQPVCGEWLPALDTVMADESYLQTRSCTITTPYTRQAREGIALLSLERNIGKPVYYSEPTTSTDTRDAVGTKYVWQATDPVISAWADGNVTSCDAWTPDPMSQANGATFQQVQTCHFTQTRTVQAREVNQKGEVRDAGVATTETHQATKDTNRSLTWLAIEDQITSSGTPTDTCAAWSPDTATVEAGTSFTQTRSCTSSMPYVKQARESIASLSLTRNVGSAVSYSQDTPRSESQQVVGTKATTRAMSIVNPVVGQSGIYSINDGNGGTYRAYVDMNTNGGYWILLGRWINTLNSSKTWGNVGYANLATSGWTNDATNYPVIPAGTLNASSKVMFVPGHPSWIAKYGAWQTFNTVASGTVLGSAGFAATTPSGATTLWAYTAGWSQNTSSGSQFGLWTVWGNGGPCGGANVVAPTKMCVMGAYDSSTNNHFDYTYLKQIYLKATN